MAKNYEISVLMDLYGALLTEKQAMMMKLYYDEDLSLGEIGEQCGISRQGVHDSIKKGERALLEYEEKLGLERSQREYVAQLREFKAQAMEIFNECRRISLSRPIAEKTVILLENLDSKLEQYDTSDLTDEDRG